MSDERYVVVTCTSMYRMRYCVPVSKLQELNKEVDIMNDPAKQIEWANDCVTMEEMKEFSQHHIGENIIDTFILDEERVLNLFDRDNDYLKDWPKSKKLEHLHDWKDNVNEEFDELS